METQTPLTFDSLFTEIGTFGRYQFVSTLLLCFSTNLLNAWTFFNLIFMLYEPDHQCEQWNVPNSTILQEIVSNSTDHCLIEGGLIENTTLMCEKWKYDEKYFHETLSTRWNIVCGRNILFNNTIGVFAIFGIIGLAVMSYIQDYYGRKMAYTISLTLSLIGSLFSLISSSFPMFVFTRAIQQTQSIASYNIPFVWALEFVGPEHRTYVNCVMVLCYSLSTVSLGLVAYACKTWIQFGLVTSLPFIIFYLYIFLLDESPRWLLSVGKIEKAVGIIEKMAIRNGKCENLPWLKTRVKLIGEASIKERENKRKNRSNACEIFRNKNVCLKVILMTIVWISNAAVYNTVAFNAVKFVDIYSAYIIQASVEAPACIVTGLLINRIGRMPPTILAMFISALFSFMSVPAYINGWDEWYATIFAALSKFGVCVSWNILFQATGELYPTPIRAIGYGVNSVIADGFIGIMPFILATSSHGKWFPMFILGILTLIGACCACLIPETMNEPMPQTVEEAERNSKVGLANAKTHLKNLAGICRKER